MSVSSGPWYDGLSVIEDLCGEPTIEGCRVPTVKPGPCPGYRRGTSTGRPSRGTRTKTSTPKGTDSERPAKKAPSTPSGRGPEKKTPPPSAAPKMGSLIAQKVPDGRRAAPELIPEFAKIMDGTYGNLRVEVGEVIQRDNRTSVTAQLYDANGDVAGITERTFHRGNGDNADELWVMHDYMDITKRDERGAGFAEDFNSQMEEWYRDSGATHTRLEANKDVGGYAQARRGFNFANAEASKKVQDRAAGMLEFMEFELETSAPDSDRAKNLKLQVDAGKALLKRMADNPFGTPGSPTAFEVANTGRQPGQGAVRDSWFGKFVLLGSKWDGVKWH